VSQKIKLIGLESIAVTNELAEILERQHLAIEAFSKVYDALKQIGCVCEARSGRPGFTHTTECSALADAINLAKIHFEVLK
jgi:hypothetical protein